MLRICRGIPALEKQYRRMRYKTRAPCFSLSPPFIYLSRTGCWLFAADLGVIYQR